MLKYRIGILLLIVIGFCSSSYADRLDDARQKAAQANNLLAPQNIAQSQSPAEDKTKAIALRKSAIADLEAFTKNDTQADQGRLSAAYVLEYQLLRVQNEFGRMATDLPETISENSQVAELWDVSGEFTAYLLFARELQGQNADLLNVLKKYFLSLHLIPGVSERDDIDPALLAKALSDPNSAKVTKGLAALVELCYKKALQLKPAKASILENWVQFCFHYATLESTENPESYRLRALQAVDAALDTKPADIELLKLAASVYRRAASVEADAEKKQKFMAQTENILKKILSIDPHQPQYVTYLIDVFMAQGQKEAGIQYFEELARTAGTPDAKLLALKALSQLYTSISELQKAQDLLEQMLKTVPDVAETQNPANPPDKARLYLYLSQVQMAQLQSMLASKKSDDTEQPEATTPEEPEVNAVERPLTPPEEILPEEPVPEDSAIEKPALEENSDDASVQKPEKDEAEKTEEEKYADKVQALLEKAIAEYPKFVNLRIQLGHLFMQIGDTKKAEKQFQQAIFLYADHTRNTSADRDDHQYMWSGSSQAELLHPVLLSLSHMYEEQESFIKAGDVITMYWSVYFYTDAIGNIIYDVQKTDNDQVERQPMLRAPARLAYEALYQAGTAYLRGNLPVDAIGCCELAMELNPPDNAVRQLLTTVYMSSARNSENVDKLVAYHKALNAWESPQDMGAAYYRNWLSYEIYKLQQMVPRRQMPENLSRLYADQIMQRLAENLQKAPTFAIMRLLRAEFYDYLWRMNQNNELDPRPDIQEILKLSYPPDGKNTDDPTLAVSYPPFESEQELQAIQDEARSLFLITMADKPAPEALKEQYATLASQCVSVLESRTKKEPLFFDALGWYAASTGAVDKAISLEKRALASIYPRAYYHLARLMLTENNPEQAIHYLENALGSKVYFPEYKNMIELLMKYKYNRSE